MADHAKKTWRIEVTEDEIQCIANLLKVLFAMAQAQKIVVPPYQAHHASEFLQRCRRIMDKKPLFLVPEVPL